MPPRSSHADAARLSRVAARAARLTPAAAMLAIGCAGDERIPTPTAPDVPALVVTGEALPALVEEPTPIAVPTYDGANEAVHPDVVEFPAGGWHGARYWLTMTPYARSDSRIENPSILASDDGATYRVPAGLTNPVVPHSGKKEDYNSDPELLYDAASDRLVLFYRFVDKRTNQIYVTTSRDGVTWSKAPKVFDVRGHRAVSPTIAPRPDAHPARMWYVDAGGKGCKTPATRVMLRTAADTTGRLTGVTWSQPVPTDLAQPGYVVWHLKVRWVASHQQYWAVYAAFPQGNPAGCDVDDLFFARSADGVHWETFPEPLLRHEDRAWTATAVYRSSFLYDPASDELQLWLSARGDDRKWRLGRARFRYTRLVEELRDTTASARQGATIVPRPVFTSVGADPGGGAP